MHLHGEIAELDDDAGTEAALQLANDGRRVGREMQQAKQRRTIMTNAYIIVALVVAIVLSFVGIIHVFWLRG